MQVWLLQCPADSISNIEVVGKGNTMTAVHWPNFKLTIAVEGCPFNLSVSIERVAGTPIVDELGAVMSDRKSTT